jgi:hypothetical protein
MMVPKLLKIVLPFKISILEDNKYQNIRISNINIPNHSPE